MALDRSFVESNRAATKHLRTLAERLTDAQLRQPLGEHWTVAIALAHVAFWERRVLVILDNAQRSGHLFTFELDIPVNDVSLPLWAAIPPREALRLALESVEAVDQRLEDYPPALLETLYHHYPRWVLRDLHRNEHLDEIEATLKG